MARLQILFDTLIHHQGKFCNRELDQSLLYPIKIVHYCSRSLSTKVSNLKIQMFRFISKMLIRCSFELLDVVLESKMIKI